MKPILTLAALLVLIVLAVYCENHATFDIEPTLKATEP